MEILTRKPVDFDTLWDKWLDEVHSVKNEIKIESVEEKEFGSLIKFYYKSVADTWIFAILYLNTKVDKPVVCYYHGHNSYIEEDHNIWHCMNLVNEGYSVVAIDMRFQGNRVKDENVYKYKDHPSACFNADELESCYIKRLDQDALKIVDIVSDETIFKELKGKDIYVAGPSQGGGLSLMVASFLPNIKCCIADVPSDCALRNRILGRFGKYQVITNLIEEHKDISDAVLNNHDYFDVINMAERITCPVICSVGIKDTTCPPAFFKVAYNLIKSHKELYEYDCGHGGFEEQHLPIKMNFIDKVYKKKFK